MSSTCLFEGNSDFYGLGVRLGVYLQWLTSLGSVYFRLDGAMDLSDSYLAFEIAIMIALYVLTFTSEEAHVAEAVIMLYMSYGGFFVVKGFRASRRNPSPQLWRLLIGNAASGCTSVYALWFWTVGRKSNHFQPPACAHPQIFMFAKIPSAGFAKVSIFFAVLSAILILAIALMFAQYRLLIRERIAAVMQQLSGSTRPNQGLTDEEIIAKINSDNFRYPVIQSTATGWRYGQGARAVQLQYFTYRFVKINTGVGNEERVVYIWPPLKQHSDLIQRFRDIITESARWDSYGLLSDDMEASTLSARLQLSIKRWSVYRKFWIIAPKLRMELVRALTEKLIPFIAFVYCILAIELTLKWNNITGVYTVHSTGQLIPFVIGVTGFVKLFVDVQHEYKSRNREKMVREHNSEATDDQVRFLVETPKLDPRGFYELAIFQSFERPSNAAGTELHPVKPSAAVNIQSTNV